MYRIKSFDLKMKLVNKIFMLIPSLRNLKTAAQAHTYRKSSLSSKL